MWNCAEDTAQKSGQAVIRLSMDETSLPLSFGDQKGAVIQRVHSQKAKFVLAKNKQRGGLTLIAAISDNTALQPRVPQVIVGSEKNLRVRDLQQCAPRLPSNVYLVRRKSGWLDAPLFCKILTWLRKAMSNVDAKMEILLLVDASPVHTHRLCLQTALRQRIRLCFVPASCTWLVQPCDTHCFRKFKAHLAKAVHEYKVRQESIEVPMTEYVGMICATIRSVLQGTKWAASFHHNGYGCRQQEISERVLQNVLPSIRDAVTDQVPDAEAIAGMFPCNKRIAVPMLIAGATRSMQQETPQSAGIVAQRPPDPEMRVQPMHLASGRGQLPHAGVVDIEDEVAEHAVQPWSRRLRPRSSCQVDAVTDSQTSHASARARLSEVPSRFTSDASAPCQSSTRLTSSAVPASPAPRRTGPVRQPGPMAMARPKSRLQVTPSSQP